MKIYRCRHCTFSVPVNKNDKGAKSPKFIMGKHYETQHKHLLPNDMTGFQYFYYLLTGKEHGSCIICKSETLFNETAMKYSRFCDNPDCKYKYREEFKQRMIGKHGKIHLLDNPEKQKEMLANRRISGEYTWSDGSARLGYTGSYEADFLKFLDQELNWRATDIMSPSPHIFTYEYDGKQRFYIPDFFIPSLSLQIEIKDDGSAKNINQDSRNKDIIKEQIMKSNENYFTYIRIVNKDYTEFMNVIKEE